MNIDLFSKYFDAYYFNDESLIEITGLKSANKQLTFPTFVESDDITYRVVLARNPVNVFHDPVTHKVRDCALEVTSVIFEEDFYFENVVSLQEFFRDMSSLQTVVWGNINTGNVVTTRAIFEGCRSLLSVRMHSLDLGSVACFDYSFKDCCNLSYVSLPRYDEEYLIDDYDVFKNTAPFLKVEFL